MHRITLKDEPGQPRSRDIKFEGAGRLVLVAGAPQGHELTPKQVAGLEALGFIEIEALEAPRPKAKAKKVKETTDV